MPGGDRSRSSSPNGFASLNAPPKPHPSSRSPTRRSSGCRETPANSAINELPPLAEEAKEIWAALRQESNVDLGEIRLEGQKTSRRVVLKADVDGSGTDAFGGVMSQGELQALSLAIFIPRATSPVEPFPVPGPRRPDPSHGPSKIDGFLEVLVRLAQTRQVIVFTHDDRLPSAIRVSRAPARIVELTRAANSVVSVTESTRPADRLLEDAFAIAVDDAVPDDIKKKAVPVLCREAIETSAWDVFSSRLLTAGRSRAELEEAWENATTTRLRVGLAVDPADDNAFEKWLAGGSARRAAMSVATKGAHKGSRTTQRRSDRRGWRPKTSGSSRRDIARRVPRLRRQAPRWPVRSRCAWTANRCAAGPLGSGGVDRRTERVVGVADAGLSDHQVQKNYCARRCPRCRG